MFVDMTKADPIVEEEEKPSHMQVSGIVNKVVGASIVVVEVKH